MSKTIMIVDDEAHIREVLCQYLETKGYDVREAESGQAAFRTATKEPVDLILLDIMMPNWNGVDAVKSLEFVDKTPAIIVISGYISENLKEELKDFDHIKGLLRKPFDIDQVFKAVVDAIGEP